MAHKIDYLWKLEDVTKLGFKSPRLQDISCAIPTGVTAILGWSGAGKSSLISLLSNMDLPDQGKVVKGPQIENSKFPFYIVPQDHGLWPHITVKDHLLKCMPTKDSSKIAEILNCFDLQNKENEYPEFLSQGECARLSIARALATEAPVILMDEPLANVDSARKNTYWEFVFRQVEEKSLSLIFTTHLPEEVVAYAENVICLHESLLVFQGKVEELYHNPENEQLASLLGPGNWFSKGDSIKSRFCRPEQLQIQADDGGEYTVNQSTFFGSYCKTILEKDDCKKAFYHRPPAVLATGIKVILSILLILLLSCSPVSSASLEYSKINSFNMPAAGQKLPGPRGLCCGNNDEVIVLDDAGRILVYDAKGKEIKRWSMPETALGHPEGVTVFKDGKIAVADTHYARVVVFDQEGEVDFMFGSRGSKEGQFYSPVGITLDNEENIYVCEYGNSDRIQKFTSKGKFIKSFGSLGSAQGKLQRASDLIWHDNKIYVADAVNNRIQVFSDEGEFIQVLKNKGKDIPLYLPYDLQLHQDGNLYVVEYGNSRITAITLTGEVIGHFGSPGTEINQFKMPWGIAVNSKGTIFVADTSNRRVIILKE